MNKPTKLPPAKRSSAKKTPGKDAVQDTAKRDPSASLLERANDSFGFSHLKPAAVPVMLDGGKSRKFATNPGRVAAQHDAVAAQPEYSAPYRQSPDTQPPTRPSREPNEPAIRFTGEVRQIVRSLLREQGLIDPDGGASTLLEEFRIIKRQLFATAAADGTTKSRRILVCSPHPNEGKTFCALNLALAMAGERDSEVLLIDADFGKPSIMARLGLEAGKGLMDALADPSLHIEDCIVGTDIPGLWVLPAGQRTGRDSEYLASERTWELLNRLTRGATNRMIIFDSPPALAATPAAELAKHVGQALLVARADMTGRAALEDAVDLLSACADIKLLLNDATFSPSGRKFGTYYGYGE